MQSATVNGVQLNYEVVGSGEPVLLISPVLADGFLPLLSEPALAGRYQLIRYHKRGWLGSTHTPSPVSIADHAADAAAFLEHLGIRCAHVAGHSSGAAVACQMALDHPEMVRSLMLLELSLLSVPCGKDFLQQAGPAFEAYGEGDHERALGIFMSAVSGLDWASCRAVLEERLPGAVAQAIEDADTFFGVELPALTEWSFGRKEAAAIRCPVLSVLGSETQPLWVEVADFLRSSLPHVDECTIEGAGHLLHIERPQAVARGIAEFLANNPISGDPTPITPCASDPQVACADVFAIVPPRENAMSHASRHSAVGMLAALLVAIVAAPLNAQDPMQKGMVHEFDKDTTMTVSTSSAIQWTDLVVEGFDPGLKLAVIHGDPSGTGDYTVRLQFPDGYRFPAHWHPNAEHLTVLSGRFILGMGATVNAAGEKTYSPGDFLYIPAKHLHFGGAKGATVIQLHGMGPFTINLGTPPK